MYSFIKVLIYVNKTPSGRLRELKNKEKVQLGNLKSGRDRLRELLITKLNSSNRILHRWSFMVAYKSVRKESFDLKLELIRIEI